MTFGVYDLFHIGHLNLLTRASMECEKLIVCVTTDEYSESKKGKRPVIPWDQRALIVASLKCVSLVDKQDGVFNKKEAVEKYKPDALFVGSDWNKDTYSGEGLGVPVVYLPHTDGISTTMLREILKK